MVCTIMMQAYVYTRILEPTLMRTAVDFHVHVPGRAQMLKHGSRFQPCAEGLKSHHRPSCPACAEIGPSAAGFGAFVCRFCIVCRASPGAEDYLLHPRGERLRCSSSPASAPFLQRPFRSCEDSTSFTCACPIRLSSRSPYRGCGLAGKSLNSGADEFATSRTLGKAAFSRE
mmetsp:Transcript_31311/g.89871  ORF Transcript_31311/g.89871 Transcript_31311/m.89871 type:complete len:172 (-) Transcript_31311:923-1438(-)